MVILHLPAQNKEIFNAANNTNDGHSSPPSSEQGDLFNATSNLANAPQSETESNISNLITRGDIGSLYKAQYALENSDGKLDKAQQAKFATRIISRHIEMGDRRSLLDALEELKSKKIGGKLIKRNKLLLLRKYFLGLLH